MSGILMIEGINLGEDPMYGGFDDYGEILPPEMSAYNMRDLMPTRDEVTQTAMAGGGMAGALIGGLAAERVLREKLRIPKGALPFVHVGIGVVGGKIVSRYNPALGVGVAAGFAGLGILRFLQAYLGVKVNLTGLDGGLSLADFGAEDESDLLPPELQGDDDDLLGIGVDEDMGDYDYGGMGQVVATEQPMSSFAGFRLM